MSSYITAIGTANPEYKISQMQVAGWMANALQMEERPKKMLHSLYESSGIETRYTVLPDYVRTATEFDFFPQTPDMEPFPSVKQRMLLYEKAALPLAINAIENCLALHPGFDKNNITHLVTVSCTGMYAPGLDIEIIEELGLPGNIQRTSIQFMGCYAAFNGIKTANYITKSHPEANVLVVCVELCTLHFQKSKERDHLVSNALFGDGAAAMLIQGKPKTNGNSLSLEAFYCDLFPQGKKDMAWHVSDFGFEMTLSSYIPSLIKGGIKSLAGKLLENLNLDQSQISYYAIHPGGRRILEVCEEELGLSPEDNCHAYEVLRDYGNMSSPTVVFVLKSIMQNLLEEDKGKNLLSFAFGPGLTVESLVAKVV